MEQKWTELKRETGKSKTTAGDFNTPLSNHRTGRQKVSKDTGLNAINYCIKLTFLKRGTQPQQYTHSFQYTRNIH